MAEDNGKQNAKMSYTNKCQKHIACSYGCELVCVNIQFLISLINMIEESKPCSDVMKKHFNKVLVLTKEDNESFKNSTKCWICDNGYVHHDVKVKDHYHITREYRGSAHIDCNINLQLNHKIFLVFHNLKSYDSHLIMEWIGTINFKTNVIPNGLEK